jgi:endonuclease IV
MDTSERGKIFTEVVQKVGIKVVIQTHTNQIRATLHKRSDRRTIDKLNDSDPFLPLTEVTIMDDDGEKEILRTPFLALNRDEVIWLIEEEASK